MRKVSAVLVGLTFVPIGIVAALVTIGFMAGWNAVFDWIDE